LDEEEKNSLPLTLLLESCKFKVTIFEDHKSIMNNLLIQRNILHEVDLLLIGTLFKSNEILDFFYYLRDLNISIPYIILSNNENYKLLSKLIDEGFYGYNIRVSEPEIILELIDTIFLNISKFNKNEK